MSVNIVSVASNKQKNYRSVFIMKNWYNGMNDEEVLVTMSRLAHEAVAYFAKDEMTASEAILDKFNAMFEEIIPYLVDKKTFWYGNKHGMYERFDNLKNDLWSIKHGIEKGMLSVLRNKKEVC
jgi:hypothetical protein